MNIYVGNLPYSVNETDLKEAFSEFGQVSSVTIVSDKFAGQSKGLGFVEMPNNSDADAAIKALNESSFKGRNIKVNQAKPKRDRPQRRPGLLTTGASTAHKRPEQIDGKWEYDGRILLACHLGERLQESEL